MLKRFFDPFLNKIVEIDVSESWYEALLSVTNFRMKGLPVISKEFYEEEMENAKRDVKTA